MNIYVKKQENSIFLNYICSFLPTVCRCSVPLFFCPPNFGRSSSSSPQSLSQSTFHRAASKGHNICSRKVCSAVFSRVFFCFVKKDRPLVTVCDNFVTICVPSFSPQLLLFSLVKKVSLVLTSFFLHNNVLKSFQVRKARARENVKTRLVVVMHFYLALFSLASKIGIVFL